MNDQLCRITLRDATVNGLAAETLVVFGYPVKIEPEDLAKREFLGPVPSDEPDAEVEVGYSKDRKKPLHLVFKNREVKLTETVFRLFVYVYEPYRKAGQTEFEFAEISEALTGDDCKMSRRAIETSTYRLAGCLSNILAPFTVNFRKETLFIRKLAQN
ncbi:MAG: hypothetical protein LBI05_10920 [Planctomycetaceae bacterium]|jgi:hypothetical protein|nr:hypothetical protein [Planctomycetaceae bacterium]